MTLESSTGASQRFRKRVSLRVDVVAAAIGISRDPAHARQACLKLIEYRQQPVPHSVHRVTYKDGKTDPIDVFIAPISSHFFPKDNPSVRFVSPPTLDVLLQKLDRIGAFGPFTFAVVISLAVEWDRPQINLDDLIKELELDPRRRAEREEYRALLWESLQLFAQTLVVGKVQGEYRDKKGNPITFIEQSPVIAITGTKYSSEMRLVSACSLTGSSPGKSCRRTPRTPSAGHVTR